MAEILIVDDDYQVCKNYSRLFAKEGYAVSIAENGDQAIGRFVSHRPDLVFLDINMPYKNGFAVCRQIREVDKIVPIVFFTALSSDVNQLRGWNIGADDYIVKGTSTSVILARIAAILDRRVELLRASVQAAGKIKLGRIEVDLATLEIRENGICIAQLTKNECLILQLLNEERGRFYSREEILGRIHNENYNIEPSSFRSAIARLREKLGPAKLMLDSLRDCGYRLVR